jgi:hypothetical protein
MEVDSRPLLSHYSMDISVVKGEMQGRRQKNGRVDWATLPLQT